MRKSSLSNKILFGFFSAALFSGVVVSSAFALDQAPVDPCDIAQDSTADVAKDAVAALICPELPVGTALAALSGCGGNVVPPPTPMPTPPPIICPRPNPLDICRRDLQSTQATLAAYQQQLPILVEENLKLRKEIQGLKAEVARLNRLLYGNPNPTCKNAKYKRINAAVCASSSSGSSSAAK